MNVATVLLHLLVVLAAAKVAAEASERLGVPAVVGEIVAGVIIGPSALGLVHGDQVLSVLGELGVILLLLEVGLEMDLEELGAVGRASLLVASVGVVVPLLAGSGIGALFGMSGKEALFVGAALTATSVGITARVFGDLRALAMIEARTVLGAAVADDVMGLIILTVVVRVVTAGSVSPLSVAGVVGLAVGFLVAATLVGIRLVPPLLDAVGRFSRSGGTLIGAALVFTLGFAELANAVKLAPIVGAFVAGLVLARSRMSGRVRRELAPLSHVLVPVFFLQIGIEADIGQFAKPAVLALAGALLVVAVVGKLVASVGVGRRGGDRLLVGIGMIPRGEVGLIFATLGLQHHVFGQRVYAAVLLVVLVTTLITPPLLHQRLGRIRPRVRVARPEGAPPPGERGWFEEREQAGGRVIDVVAEPTPGKVLVAALDVARRVERARPSPAVFDWLANVPGGPLRWDDATRQAFRDLLDEMGPRAWRFLSVSGVLERALPELDQAMQTRQHEAFDLDPLAGLDFPTLAEVRSVMRSTIHVEHPERVALAAVIRDVAVDETAAVILARRTAGRLGVGAREEQALAGLVGDVSSFAGVARPIDGPRPEQVLQLAVHVGELEQARGLYVLAAAEASDQVDRARLEALYEAVAAALAHPELVSREAANVIEARRATAGRQAADPATRALIAVAPRAFVLTQPPPVLAEQTALIVGLGASEGVEVACHPDTAPDTWRVDVASRDRPGLLAAEARVLVANGCTIDRADVATWDNGATIGSFLVTGKAPDNDVLRQAVAAQLGDPVSGNPVPDADVTFDNAASVWHTVCRVRAVDRPGLLADLASAFTIGGTSVHSAVVSTEGPKVLDVFELTDAHGDKLDDATQAALSQLIASGVPEVPYRSGFARIRSRLRRLALP